MAMYRTRSAALQRTRFVLALTAAVGLHAAALPAIWPNVEAETEEADVSGAVLIELQPLPVAVAADDASSMPVQATAASDVTVAQQHAEAKPQKSEDAPILPQSDVTDVDEDLKIATASPTETKEEVEPDRAVPTEERQSQATATATASTAQAAQEVKVKADTIGERAQATEQGISEKALKKAIDKWQRDIVTSIAEHRRYPAEARERRRQGTATVRFGIDRQGKLVVSELRSTSGHDSLDREALETLKRVKSFPAPPKALAGETFDFQMPIKFSVIE